MDNSFIGMDDGSDLLLFSVVSRPRMLMGGNEELYSGGLSKPIDDKL